MNNDCYGVEIVENKAYIESVNEDDSLNCVIRSYHFIGTLKECEEYADKKGKKIIYTKI